MTKGYCSECFKEIDETEQLRGVCNDCRYKDYEWIIKHDGVITRRIRNDK